MSNEIFRLPVEALRKARCDTAGCFVGDQSSVEIEVGSESATA